jgi:MFS family permease
MGPRNFADILSETFRIYGRNFFRLLAIVAIVEVLLTIVAYFLPTPMGLEDMPQLIPQLIIVSIILLVLQIVAYPWMQGALIHAVSEQNIRRPVGIGRAYRFAWRRLGSLIVASILAALAIGVLVALAILVALISSLAGPVTLILLLVFIPAAVYLAVRWTFFLQAALLEHLGPVAALSRSWDLVKGNWWRVFGIMLVVSIIAVGISLILGLIPMLATTPLGSMLAVILATPIAVTASTLLYYDLRVRKEDYNLDTLAGELGIEMDSKILF